MSDYESKAANALMAMVEVGERRGNPPGPTRHCTWLNRDSRTIGSVSTEEWREGQITPTKKHTLREWIELGDAW